MSASTITPRTFELIAGQLFDKSDRAYLRAAEREADRFLEHGGCAVMSSDAIAIDSKPDHFDAFAAIAQVVEGERVNEATAALKHWNGVIAALARKANAPDCPTDAACNKYSPALTAAYYFGLVMGLRIGGAR